METLAFICHSNVDAALAEKIVIDLEKAGIRCWIAPRNIQSGTTYAAAIVQGIKRSSYFIFVFSKSSNHSDAVVNEIENANALKIPIIPFKIDKDQYSDSLDYYLRSRQAIIAYEKPFNIAVAELAHSISDTIPVPPSPQPSKKKIWLITGIVVIVLGLFAILFFTNQRKTNTNNDSMTTKELNDTSREKQTPVQKPDITMNFLKGTWLIEFGDGGASERASITTEGKYYVNGAYVFLINNFVYEASRNQVKFVKSSILDNRVLMNTLTIQDGNTLTGTESSYNIKYIKISD